MLIVALILCLVCIARAEHVIASDVWITFHGEEFKKREADELRPSGKRASAEQRWRLYQQTDGDRWPWLFFGIRSHRLLVAALRRKGVRRFALLALRFAWLNWFFPLWTGSLLLAVASAHHGGWTQSLLALTAVVLCVNTSGTLVGAVFAAFTMGGVARHHDSAGVDRAELNNAIFEVGYALAAVVTVVISGTVAVQVFACGSGGDVSGESLVASLGFLLSGSNSPLIPLSPDWLPLVRLCAHILMLGTGFAFATITTVTLTRTLSRAAT